MWGGGGARARVHTNVIGRHRSIRYNSITLTIHSQKRKSKNEEKNLREKRYFNETDTTADIRRIPRHIICTISLCYVQNAILSM